MNLLALVQQLTDLNEQMESGEGLDQLVVVVGVDASDDEIAQAQMRACEERGVSLEQIDQTVIVKIQEAQPPAEVDAYVQV